MELMSKIQVTWDNIINLSLQCHAIDATGQSLFERSTINDKEYIKQKYNEMISSSLLNLAISTRTKFYQGVPYDDTVSYINHCGFMYKYKNKIEQTENFNIKTVCDKIIHASYAIKFTDKDDQFTITKLYEVDKNDPPNIIWFLEFSVTLFAQGVINWALDKMQAEAR